MAVIADRFKEMGLHPSHQPLGLINPGEPGGCILCNTCNSFPCNLRVKSDADVCAVSPALRGKGVTLWTNAYAERLLTNGQGDRVVAAEIIRDGERFRVEAPLFVVSCGAVNSAALLLRSTSAAHPEGLGNSSGLVGRRYMAHLATMLGGFWPPKNHTVFQKTLAINDFYLEGPNGGHPLGQIQSQGRSRADMAKWFGSFWTKALPSALYNYWFSRGVEWLAMTEDLPAEENRVTLNPQGRIQLSYEPRNQKAHAELVALTRRILREVGFWVVVPVSMGVINTTHQCGTAVFGTDPGSSVLDPFCRSHDVENLFVVDASFFPSSAAVNPGLTVAAQALRAADHIKDHHLK
jgi:choline dehydrogenase-like flavoprotein